MQLCSTLEQIVTAKVFLYVTCPPCELIWHPSSSVSQSVTTTLMIASSKGHSGMVRKLLQAGATVNTANKVCRQMLKVTPAYNRSHTPLPHTHQWGNYTDTCILYIKVWAAHICSAYTLYMHTYHRMGGLPSTLQHRRDMRMLWSCCLSQKLT